MESQVCLGFSLANAFMVRLTPGQDIFDEVKSLAARTSSGRLAILSGLGSVSDVQFRNLKDAITRPVSLDKTVLFEGVGPYELLSIVGNVLPMGEEQVVHIHVTLGTSPGPVIGGHLFAARVFTTTELVCVELPGDSLFRERSSVTGLTEIVCNDPEGRVEKE